MGSSNRDYMQDDYGAQGPSWGHDVPTTKWLVIVTVIVFFLQTILTHSSHEIDQSNVAKRDDGLGGLIYTMAFRPLELQLSYIEEWFPLDAGKVLHGQIWRLVTFIFCHDRDSPFTLVFNMVALWYLGSNLERMYGSREILWFYLTAAVVCGLVFTAFGLVMPLPYPLQGATSCVMALLTLYATHYPTREILFCWIVPVQIRVLLLIYVALDLYGILQAYSGRTPWVTVAYTSQIWGVAFGYLYRRFDWHLTAIAEMFDVRSLQRSMRRATAGRRLKVYQPEPMTNLDEQVDAILAKIHEHGSESLTDHERSILQRASERAKDRL